MRKRLLVLATLMTVTACVGGSDGGGTPTFKSGVDPNKRGDEVTQDEVVQFCEALGDYAERRLNSIDYYRAVANRRYQ